MTPPAQPLAKDLKAIENFIYSTMNHTPEWKAAEQAYQNILNTRSRPAPASPDADMLLNNLLAKFMLANKRGNFRPWNIQHIQQEIEYFREELRQSRQEREQG